MYVGDSRAEALHNLAFHPDSALSLEALRKIGSYDAWKLQDAHLTRIIATAMQQRAARLVVHHGTLEDLIESMQWFNQLVHSRVANPSATIPPEHVEIVAECLAEWNASLATFQH